MEHSIKTFEDACKALKLDSVKCVPDVSGMPEKHQKAAIASCKLMIVAEALNEGWTPDWNNFDEVKYWPWFDMETYDGSSSPGFSLRDFDGGHDLSAVGSRLCFKSSELARYAGTQFIDLYRDYFVIE